MRLGIWKCAPRMEQGIGNDGSIYLFCAAFARYLLINFTHPVFLELNAGTCFVVCRWIGKQLIFFAWLVLQNRIWTADRLQRRGWQNCGNCPLCNQVQESSGHLLYKCHFTIRSWKEILTWCGCHDIALAQWVNEASVEAWWTKLALDHGVARKAMSSLLMLISWKVLNERNARVFRNVVSSVAIVVSRIKKEARAWCLAGAKFLGNVIPGE